MNVIVELSFEPIHLNPIRPSLWAAAHVVLELSLVQSGFNPCISESFMHNLKTHSSNWEM